MPLPCTEEMKADHAGEGDSWLGEGQPREARLRRGGYPRAPKFCLRAIAAFLDVDHIDKQGFYLNEQPPGVYRHSEPSYKRCNSLIGSLARLPRNGDERDEEVGPRPLSACASSA